MRINKSERKYLIPAIVHGWAIFIYSHQKTCYWDDDHILPVSVGALAEKLKARGLLEEINWGNGHYRIRATKLLSSFVCRECNDGRFYDDDGNEVEKCKKCDGTGALLENT